jgi:hypothetical protein
MTVKVATQQPKIEYNRGLSIEDVQRNLKYNPETGQFKWRIVGKGRSAAPFYGTLQTKTVEYRYEDYVKPNGEKAVRAVPVTKEIMGRFIRVNGVICQAAQLAWAIMMGEWRRVGFKDGNKANVKWDNLMPYDAASQREVKTDPRNPNIVAGDDNSELVKYLAKTSLASPDKLKETEECYEALIKYLLKNLLYNPEMGEFCWTDRAAIYWFKGSKTTNGGLSLHKTIPLQRHVADPKTGDMKPIKRKVTMPAHNAAWLLQTGEMPSGRLKHLNGDNSDNRWENLAMM